MTISDIQKGSKNITFFHKDRDIFFSPCWKESLLLPFHYKLLEEKYYIFMLFFVALRL